MEAKLRALTITGNVATIFACTNFGGVPGGTAILTLTGAITLTAADFVL